MEVVVILIALVVGLVAVDPSAMSRHDLFRDTPPADHPR